MPEIQDTNTEARELVAPDEITIAAANAAVTEHANKSEPEIIAAAHAKREHNAAALAKVKQKHYRTVHGGVMIDPDTGKSFNGENSVKSPLTSWLDFQIKNGKITEDE